MRDAIRNSLICSARIYDLAEFMALEEEGEREMGLRD